jgi:hypothetical protein
MKKIITISAISLAIVMSPTLVSAQGVRQGQGGTQQMVQDPALPSNLDTLPLGGQQGQGAQQAEAGNRGLETAAKSLSRVAERVNNPEVGEQVRAMAQNHEQVQVRTKTALQQMSQRSQAVKFMIGPDYKNAGQVRSDVVGLRNDISKLEKIKEDSLPADVGDVQGAIDELQVEADALETQVTEELSGFSLFGWVARLLNK